MCKCRLVIFCLSLSLLVSCSINEQVYQSRQSKHAGSMYPSDKFVLNQTIETYISNAEKSNDKINGHIVGLISPHAGYIYSGQVAAYGYAQIKNKNYSRIYILGTSHNNFLFRGIATYSYGSWETPYGNLFIDEEATNELIKNLNFVYNFPKAFENDHTIETQLPFLQKNLSNFKIVPILFGDITETERRQFAKFLTDEISKNKYSSLVIASSDMSHYKPYEYTVNIDNSTIKDIKRLDSEKLFNDLKNKTCELCGYHGVLTLVDIAKELDLKTKLLKYSNSGDVTKDKSSVVGYSSIAFYLSNAEQQIGEKHQQELLAIARNAIVSYFKKGNLPDLKDVGDLNIKQGIFVTLKKGNAQRGCIGHIKPDAPLTLLARDMAISSAFKDPRYPPLSVDELSDIKIEISVLSPLKEVTDISEIEVGKHGLYLCRENVCGVLLPQVALAFGWNREEFLEHTSLKAGFSKTAWEDAGTKIYLFTAQVFSE